MQGGLSCLYGLRTPGLPPSGFDGIIRARLDRLAVTPVGGRHILNRIARNVAWIAVLLLLMYVLRKATPGVWGTQPKALNYTQLVEKIEHKEVKTARIEKTRVTGTLVGPGSPPYVGDLPSDPWTQHDLVNLMRKNQVQVEYPSPVISEAIQNVILSIAVPVIFIAVFWILFWRQAQSTGNQALSFGRSRAKRLTDSVPKVTFDDVAGVEEAKQELEEVVEFLKNPKKFQALGAKIPKGVLLLGPPGCGKTLLARAIAGEAGVPFFHISGSDFVEMFVGVGASRVRDLFDTAKANKPSLIFIDEIDAVGRQRGAGLGGGHDEREQTLNQLLVEMDGFDPNSGVILIAATNRPDVLDPAIMRPGRFDRRVVVDNPDCGGRRAILNVHTKGKPLGDDVSLDNLARRTPGFSGADLANLVNEAALLAARKEQNKITMADFEASIDRVVAGPERKSRLLGDKEKVTVAYHEVGHAVVMELLPNHDPVHKVTILARGMALGITMSMPMDDKYLHSRSEMLDIITSFMGGRVAEEMVFGEIWTGASNDIERASDLARRMVTEYGMSERLGPIALGRRHGNPFLGRDLMEDRNYSEEIAKAIDEEVRAIMEHCYNRAKRILEDNRETMERIVHVLLERETIEREEFLALMQGAVPAPEPTPISSSPSAPSGGEIQPSRRPEPFPRMRPEPA
jgi:cell division protease FtsH